MGKDRGETGRLSKQSATAVTAELLVCPMSDVRPGDGGETLLAIGTVVGIVTGIACARATLCGHLMFIFET